MDWTISASEIGFVLGALLVQPLALTFVLMGFSEKIESGRSIFWASLIATVISLLLSSIGRSNGGPPDFYGWYYYVLSGVFWFSVYMIKLNSSNFSENAKPDPIKTARKRRFHRIGVLVNVVSVLAWATLFLASADNYSMRASPMLSLAFIFASFMAVFSYPLVKLVEWAFRPSD